MLEQETVNPSADDTRRGAGRCMPAPPGASAGTGGPAGAVASSSSGSAGAMIGVGKKVVRALAFSGGGNNAAMQLGVIHAFLVANLQPPDVVAGVSAGAVNAVSLAEVLQEKTPEDRVRRFREILAAYEDSSGMLRAVLPDLTEAKNYQPLTEYEPPTLFPKEREDRRQAQLARWGVVELLNLLFRIRIPLRHLFYMLRSYMGLRSTRLTRGWIYLASLLLIGVGNLPRVLALVAKVVAAAAWAPQKGKRQSFVPLLLVWLAVTIEGLAWFVPCANYLRFSALGNFFAGLVLLWPALFIPLGILCLLSFSQHFKRRLRWVIEAGFLQTVFVVPFLAVTTYPLAWAGKDLHSFPSLTRLCATLWYEYGAHFRFAICATVCVALLSILVLWAGRRRLLWLVLENFDLDQDLGNSYPLKSLFIRLFDPDYYGKADLDDVMKALFSKRPARQQTSSASGKRVSDYTKDRKPYIRVALIAADYLEGGSLVELDPELKVVDALMAASAVVPFVKPQRPRSEKSSQPEKVYVDASNVAEEPVAATVRLLKSDLDPEVKQVLIYPVSDMPVEGGKIPKDQTFGSLIDTIWRYIELRRLGLSRLERTLTRFYSNILSADGGAKQLFLRLTDGSLASLRAAGATQQALAALGCLREFRTEGVFKADLKRILEENGLAGLFDRLLTDAKKEGECFVRTEMLPIEPKEPLRMNQKLLAASSPEERNRLMRWAVAQGCCCSLRALRPQVLASCNRSAGSGLPEVCAECSRPFDLKTDALESVLVSGCKATEWPTQKEEDVEQYFPDRKETTFCADGTTGWPQDHGPLKGKRPTISLVFSGGVFRGVFQVGVLNGLNEAGIPPNPDGNQPLEFKPDLLAGSSVGSIMVGMAARVFQEPEWSERQLRMVRVVRTFLSLDKLVLTNRLVDALTRLHLEIRATPSSLADIETVLRSYNEKGSGSFFKKWREVHYTFEQLFAMNQQELLELRRTYGMKDMAGFYKQARFNVSKWLGIHGIAEEALGAEPLAFLIKNHVLPANPPNPKVSCFAKDGMRLLVTTTNMHQGRLQVWGAPEEDKGGVIGGQGGEALLLEALLASSAFPGVFRPRWSREVLPTATAMEQYMDGGVIDNLPLEAVTSFLYWASQKGIDLIAARPKDRDHGETDVPHLLITASLEPMCEDMSLKGFERRQNLYRYWKRVGQLGYNRKIRQYAEAQQDYRQIWDSLSAAKKEPRRPPVNLEVLTITPKWLVGSFAFNEVLGFRVEDQARSIAHGCSATLDLLANGQPGPNRGKWGMWRANWGIPPNIRLRSRQNAADRLSREDAKKGLCHRVADKICPFSERGLQDLKKKLEEKADRYPERKEELEKMELDDPSWKAVTLVYKLCGEKYTHQKRPD